MRRRRSASGGRKSAPPSAPRDRRRAGRCPSRDPRRRRNRRRRASRKPRPGRPRRASNSRRSSVPVASRRPTSPAKQGRATPPRSPGEPEGTCECASNWPDQYATSRTYQLSPSPRSAAIDFWPASPRCSLVPLLTGGLPMRTLATLSFRRLRALSRRRCKRRHARSGQGARRADLRLQSRPRRLRRCRTIRASTRASTSTSAARSRRRSSTTPNKVKYLPINAKDRPTILASGEIDVLIRNTTWTHVARNRADVLHRDQLLRRPGLHGAQEARHRFRAEARRRLRLRAAGHDDRTQPRRLSSAPTT